MLKNKYNFLLLRTTLLALFFMFGFINNVFAKLSIIEVMYDAKGTDTDREWVKIINDSESEVTISKIKLFINGSGHLIKDLSGSVIIDKEETMLIVDDPVNFIINYPSYSGRILDSSFTLTNTSGIVEIRDDKGVLEIDKMLYSSSVGASGDGKSLQNIDGVWVSGVPTIGFPYDYIPTVIDDTIIDPILSTTTATTTDSTSTSTVATTTVITKIVNHYSTHYVSEDLSDYVEEESLKISAGRERIAYVGTPINFTAKNNKDGKKLDFKWSFGDATENKGNEISHIYKYPGEYVVVLNAQYNGEKAVSRTNVKVLEPKITLLINQNSLEITNNGDDEINIGDWKIKGSQSEFLIPRDTIISPKNKVVLSLSDIGFVPESLGSIRIEDQSINTIAFAQDLVGGSIKKDNNDQSIVLKNNYELEKILGMKVKDAEKIVADQRLKLAKTTPKEQPTSDDIIFEKSISDNNQIRNDQGVNKEFMVATVNETINSTTSVGFWKMVGKFPINSIKYIGSIFYDL
ncbi:MAG: PKD domain-containing protein [Candidatus Pacebacteria bacterium]|nr:PKD domain-containing protein [Candidatus Paceibacterota bacterium]